MDQPGFYPDPTAPDRLRYWNGLIWTEDTKPEPSVPEPEDSGGPPEDTVGATNADAVEGAIGPVGGETGSTPTGHTPEPGADPDPTPEPGHYGETPKATRKTMTIGLLILVALLGTVFFLTKDTIAFAGGATRTTASANKDYTSTAPAPTDPRGSRCTLRYQYIAEGTVYTGTTGCSYLFSGGKIDIEYANWFPGVSRLADPPSRFTVGLLIQFAIRLGIAVLLVLGMRWMFRLARGRTPASPASGQAQANDEAPFDPEKFDALIKPPAAKRGDPPAPGTR